MQRTLTNPQSARFIHAEKIAIFPLKTFGHIGEVGFAPLVTPGRRYHQVYHRVAWRRGKNLHLLYQALAASGNLD